MSGYECLTCGAEMIWGGDNEEEHEDFSFVSNFTCPSCNSYMEFYTSEGKTIDATTRE